MSFFSGNPLWQLVAQADTISKMVLLTLLAMSVVCWAIFLGKLIIFRIKTKQFQRISEKQVADIATIAPGIAEALITTLAGLIVAIPALIMFNYLQTKTRQLEHHLFVLADRMIFILQHLRTR